MTHPIVECVATIDATLKSVADVDPVFMRGDEKATAMVELQRLEGQVKALKMRVMAASPEVAADAGTRNVAAWLAHRTRNDRGTVWADGTLAQALDTRWLRLAAAVTEGRVNPAQAQVIHRALAALPDDVDDDIVAKAEQWLVEAAARFTPKRLRVLGRKILDVVAPEIAEAEEAKALEKEEQRAEEHTWLRFKPLGNGITRMTGQIPDPVAARIKTILEAYTSPRHDAMTGEASAERVPADRRRGMALRTLFERLDTKDLPQHGGDTTTVMVTIDLDQLRSELGVAGLIDNDDAISAAEVRRLACEAQIVPVVLGGKSEILDLGRSSRLFTPAQRKALRLRDKCCRVEGCDVPATWCEAHHRDPWSKGGKTSLKNGVLLCAFHHHRIHDPQYTATDLPDGDIRLHRRT